MMFPSTTRRSLTVVVALLLAVGFLGACAPAPTPTNQWNRGTVVRDDDRLFHTSARWTCLETGVKTKPKLVLDGNVDYYVYPDGLTRFYAARPYNDHELVNVYSLRGVSDLIESTGRGCDQNTPRVF